MVITNLLSKKLHPIFNKPLSRKNVYHLNLSSSNSELNKINTKSTESLHKYIFDKITKNQKVAAAGGYLEKRSIYQKSAVFEASTGFRNIHLGIDVWLPEKTKLLAPADGVIHSFQNNKSFGDYGPTLILKHTTKKGKTFHSLYGHLSIKSLSLYQEGKLVKAGETIGWLGAPTENVGWPPHLHFQIIIDLQGKKGDYPGVCNEEEIAQYKQNCPDPSGFIYSDYGK